MSHTTHHRGLVTLALIASGCQLASAATVSGSYQGIIDSDSGLGLVGQVMRVDFSYDSAAPGSPSGNATFYTDLFESMTVTIGSNSWQWQGAGGSYAFLNNDDVITFLIGTEDRIIAEAATFVGPDLVPLPVAPETYSLRIALSDNEPAFAPDGLSDDTQLPGIAPDPDLFSGPGINQLAFSFRTGSGEGPGSVFYSISTAGVSNAAVIPVPAAVWLFLSALGIMRLLAPRAATGVP
jgi:hypothetical protein